MFDLDDESKYWHFAYEGHEERLHGLAAIFARASQRSIELQRAEIARHAPVGWRLAEDGLSLLEFDWEHGPYAGPTDAELLPLLAEFFARHARGVPAPDDLYFGCYELACKGDSIGIGPCDGFRDEIYVLRLSNLLPYHWTYVNLGGWAGTFAVGDDLVRLAKRGYDSSNDKVRAVAKRYAAIGIDGGAVVNLEIKHPGL